MNPPAIEGAITLGTGASWAVLSPRAVPIAQLAAGVG